MRRLLALSLAVLTACAPLTPPADTPPPSTPAAPAQAAATENPCTEQQYQNLKKRPINSLSEREYEYFMERDKACTEYQRTLAQVEPQVQAVKKAHDSLSMGWSLVLLSTFVGVLTYLIITPGQ